MLRTALCGQRSREGASECRAAERSCPLSYFSPSYEVNAEGRAEVAVEPVDAAVVLDQKNSPSRLRFRPFIRLTFGFRLQPTGSTSI